MNEALKVFLSLSFSGTLLILVLFLCKPLYKNKLTKQWQYYIWFIVIARLLLPFTPETSLVGNIFQKFNNDSIETETNLNVELNENTLPQIDFNPNNVSNYENSNRPTESIRSEQVESKSNSLYTTLLIVEQNIWILWLMVAIGLLIRKITIYQSFVKYIKAGQVEISNIELWEQFGELVEQSGIKKAIGIYRNNLISSPILIGFFRPCIILPTTEISQSDFQYTILHELTHYKRGDMFYKWLVQFTICLHWFNPFVYLMSHEINRFCELSCDEAIIQKLDIKDRKAYGDTLLNALKVGGSYKNSLASVTLSESKDLIKERLNAIMNFKKNTKLINTATFLISCLLVCGFTFSGAYASNNNSIQNNTTNFSITPTIKLQFATGNDYLGIGSQNVNITDIVIDNNQSYPQIYYLDVTEDERKILISAEITGNSNRTIELISPNGVSVRKYILNENGFSEEGSMEYLTFFEKSLMVTDVAERGLWTLKIDSDSNNDDTLILRGMLIEKYNFTFVSDKDNIKPTTKNETFNKATPVEKEDSKYKNKKYDYYRTYDEALLDIESGYVFNIDKSFSIEATPFVTGTEPKSFYVHHNNTIDIEVNMNNLIKNTNIDELGIIFGDNSIEIDSFVKFEIFDPSGKTAFSFVKNAEEIDETINLPFSLTLYPGEWKYQVNFAYATDGKNESNLKISGKYRNTYEDDIEWLKNNKLQ